MRTPLAPDVEFTRVSPDYVKVKTISGLIIFLISVAIAGVISYVVAQWWIYIVAGVALCITGSLWVIGVRAAKFQGYADGGDALLIARGRLKRRLDVIPYGRMQEVNVESGPILRKYGLSKITLETASVGSDGSIEGIVTAEANRLRTFLTERGHTLMEGM